MTALDTRPEEVAEPEEHPGRSRGFLAWLTTTDHKRIGMSYMLTAFVFFMIGGALAMVIRAQLSRPELNLVSEEVYNETFTMHGSIMLFLFLGPFAFGLANYLIPLQIGARDMAFPRLNAFGYWVYLFGGIVMVAGVFTSDGAASFGWFAYSPLSDSVRTPGLGGDLWIAGVALTGVSGITTGVNIVTTVLTMRAKGMTPFRMTIYTWNMLVTGLLVLMAFPVVTAAGAMLYADRHFGAHIFDASAGGQPILWQHLFWFFGHPEVYILVLPFFGVVTEIFAVFSRRPVFGYMGLVFATCAIAALSMGVWAHHMYATGAVLLPWFTIMSMLIAVPTGVKFFNWIGTMWGGQIQLKSPMLFSVGFLLMFLLGGLTGVMLASAPIDIQVTDSYFVVAHFHYTLFGGSVFALFAGIYYWFPKFTGRMLNERWAVVHFVMMFLGFNLTFLCQHLLGLEGMPRRVASYLDSDGFGTLNLLSSLGAFLLGASTLPFLWNVWTSWRHGPIAGDNPWDGHALEWATTSPPPEHNFDEPLPPIRSERPVWDANHPEATTWGRPQERPVEHAGDR